MPNIRILLWGVLAAILYLNYEAWMHDYETPPSAAIAKSVADATGAASAAPGAHGSLGESVPQATTAAPAPAAASPESAVPPAAAPEPAAAGSQLLHVRTDVLDVSINLKGGELDRAELLQYPLRKDAPNIPVTLLSREPPASLY